MIRCTCGGKTQVTNTRPIADGIWRQRTCTNCKLHITTFEQVCVTISAPRGATKGSTKTNPIVRPKKRIIPANIPLIQKNMVRSEPPGSRMSSRSAMEDARMAKELTKDVWP